MASLVITNVSSASFFLNDIYAEIDAAGTVTVSRSAAEISSMALPVA